MSKIIGKLKKADREIYRAVKNVKGDDAKSGIALIAKNRYVVSVRLPFVYRTLSGSEYTRYDERLYEYLVARKFVITEDGLIVFLKSLSPDDDFLSALHARLVFCCIKGLHAVCIGNSEINVQNIFALLTESDRLDYERLYEEASPTERFLLRNKTYHASDTATRAYFRSKLKKHARKHKLRLEKAIAEASADELDRIFFSEDGKRKKTLYFASVSFITFGLFFLCCSAFGINDTPHGIVIAFLLLFSFYECGKYITDYCFSRLCTPHTVMRLKREECKENCKTLIVITSLLNDGDKIYENLEDICLSNNDDIFSYGILADLGDSVSPDEPQDAVAIAAACDRINSLTRKYGDRFYLFIRDREFSSVQECFMAPERKRGAVIELAKLLDGRESKLKLLCGEYDKLTGTRYVITLDSDTVIPPDEAVGMVACAAHPANAPIVDKITHTVTRGHGIFQPRISTNLESGTKTAFSTLTSGNAGFDSYGNTSFELYHDIFGEANFCGKGIFDVKCFSECIPDAFPDGVILSHDLLEGLYLRCGGINDITLYDSTPSNAISYYKRLDRWIRGDIQSLIRTKRIVKDKSGTKTKNPLSLLSKYKLFDNVRRAFTPVFSLAAFLLALFFPHRIAASCSVFAVFYILLPSIVHCSESLLFTSFGMIRKYSSLVMSSFWSTSLSMLLKLMLFPHEAFAALRACASSIRGLATGRHLLDWVSAARAEGSSDGTPERYIKTFFPSLLLGFCTACFVDCGLYRFFGLLFMSSPFVLFSLCLPVPHFSVKKTKKDMETIEKYAADSWKYFDESVTEKYNFLPPDNYSQVGGVAFACRTSPTNIGLYMLSCLCACDFKLISPHSLADRLSHTVSTLKKLKKFEGNLYNWYDIVSLDVLDNFVSSVDSGNFLVCMVTLSAGLEQYFKDDIRLYDIKRDIDGIIDETHIEALYDKKKHLFAIGMRVGVGLTEAHYDIYMSEARTLGYFAVAYNRVEASHLRSGARVLLTENGYIGLGSWSGTCFEYFMPNLFLPLYRSSLLYEACRFAYREQCRNRIYVRSVPVYGVSESCYYEFDKDMNYQYKANGIDSLRLRCDENDSRVISPYSSFLMLCISRRPLDNLSRLKRIGMYGKYGFYEALDCSSERCDKCEIIRCFMSHHIGMSLIAMGNFAFNDIFVKRFTSDAKIHSCLLALSERIPVDGIPYKPSPAGYEPFVLGIKYSPKNEHTAGVISNTRDRAVFDESGHISLYYGYKSVTRNGHDPLGFRFMSSSVGVYHLPFDGVKLNGSHEAFRAELKDSSLTLSLDQKNAVFQISVSSPGKSIICFEPVLASLDAYMRHISFSRLFVSYSCEDNVLYFTRCDRESGKRVVLCIGAFDSSGNALPFEYETIFDRILPPSPSLGDFEALFSKKLKSSEDTDGGACVQPFFVFRCEYGEYRLLLAVANDKKTAFDIMLHRAVTFSDIQTSLLPALGDMQCEMLSYLHTDIRLQSTARLKRGNSELLWNIGLSGEEKSFLIDLRNATPPCDGLEEYLSRFILLHKNLLIRGERYSTVILCPELGYENTIYKKAETALRSCGVYLLLNEPHGFRLVKEKSTEITSLLFDSCFCRAEFPSPDLIFENAPLPDIHASRDLIAEHRTCRDPFTVVKRREDRIMSYIYSSPHFGTLLTANSLGFTYFENSHFGKLTNSDTDAMNECGERLYLLENGIYYDLCFSAHTVKWGDGCAVYSGKLCGEKYLIRVTTDGELNAKAVHVSFDGERSHTLVYRCEFVLGERTTQLRCLKGNCTEKYLSIENMYSKTPFSAFLYSCDGVSSEFDGLHGQLTCFGRNCTFTLGYHTGNPPFEIIRRKSFGEAVAAYKKQVSELHSHFELKSSDSALDLMFRSSLYQTLHCRMYSRCGFYQNGGAYGFRDQLQDSLAVMYSFPNVTKQHILRCAAYQYEEGDVMHWFHEDIKKGVRTRCSDDMLWLVYVVGEYISATADTDILSRKVGYIRSPVLAENENERYESAVCSELSESIYMHCVRAVEYSLKLGIHGLPLFGSGDWNDGMNNAGGESVWLAMFTVGVLRKMSVLSEMMSDDIGKKKYENEALHMERSIEEFAFNGKYYVRGTYKSGEIIGEKGGCRIDALPQAFAAFFLHDRKRIGSSLECAYKELYDDGLKLIRLLIPPFDNRSDIGYIAHYPEGIRENGGQYTHGVIWLIAAMLHFGQAKRGYELLRTINPCDRSGDEYAIHRYGGEKYVFAGDVYTAHGHEGECGWSWYTGSSGWFYQTVLTHLLGYKQYGKHFTLEPKLCREFNGFKLKINQSGTLYTVNAALSDKSRIILDGKEYDKSDFVFDGGEHTVSIEIRK